MKAKSINKEKDGSKKPARAKPQTTWRAKREQLGYYGPQKGPTLEEIEELFKEYREQHLLMIKNYDEDWLTARRFFLLKGFNQETASDWVKRYPHLKAYYDTGKEIVGDKRHVGMMLGKLDTKAASVDMYNYLPDWKEAEAREDQRKIDIQIAVKKATLEEENRSLDKKITFLGLGMKSKSVDEDL